MDDALKKKIGETLKKAIKGEKDGYTFYKMLAENATNEAAKKKLENLRDDEIRHEATLIAIYHKYVGDTIGTLPEKGINALAEVFRKGQIKKRRSDIEFINLAIEAELAATKYYQDERELIDDPTFREIFDQLATEEHGHYELLKAEKEAIGGNYYWFDLGDSSPMEH